MSLFHIIVWVVVGLIAGALARLIMPGRDPMGILMTIVLGIGGSFLAGVIGQFFGWYQAGEGAGFIASIVVAILLLVIYGMVRSGPSRPPV